MKLDPHTLSTAFGCGSIVKAAERTGCCTTAGAVTVSASVSPQALATGAATLTGAAIGATAAGATEGCAIKLAGGIGVENGLVLCSFDSDIIWLSGTNAESLARRTGSVPSK